MKKPKNKRQLKKYVHNCIKDLLKNTEIVYSDLTNWQSPENLKEALLKNSEKTNKFDTKPKIN